MESMGRTLERDKFDNLMIWLNNHNFQPVSDYVADENYFPDPLVVPGYRSFAKYIMYSEPKFMSGGGLTPRLKDFQKSLFTRFNVEIFSIFESLITGVDYDLVYNKVRAFGASSFAGFNFCSEHPATMQILVNPDQSVLEILETLVVPNIGIVSDFEFVVPDRRPEVYLAYYMVHELTGVSIRKLNKGCCIPGFNEILPMYYPPTLAIVLSDADIISTVARLVEMICSLPKSNRKVDIYVQQSIKTKFCNALDSKLGNPSVYPKVSSILDTRRVSPVLAASHDPDETYARVIAFRKVDEAMSLINRYQRIREASIWSINVSLAMELTRSITKCQYFSINTYNEFYLTGHYNFLHPSRTPYQILGFEPLFSSRVSINTITAGLAHFSLDQAVEQVKKTISFNEVDFFVSLGTELPKKDRSNIAHSMSNILKVCQANQRTFHTVNQCLLLRQYTPFGIVFLQCHTRLTERSDWFFTLVGCIIVCGNCCVLSGPPSDKPLDKIPIVSKLKSVFGSKLILATTINRTLANGWVYQDDELVGLSLDVETVDRSINIHNLFSIFGLGRSIFFPISDQTSLTRPTSY